MDYGNKVYTLTKDTAGQDAEIFMGIGLRERMLSEENLSSEKMPMIKVKLFNDMKTNEWAKNNL